MKNIKRILLFLLSIIGYLVLGYFTERENFYLLLIFYFTLFLSFLEIYRTSYNTQEILKGIHLAIILRFILIAATPKLSDDYFRFIWDGQLINNGFNPYTYTPSEFMNRYSLDNMPLAQYCYTNLNNLQLNNYSCYTPLNQIIYSFASFLFPNNFMANIITMRIFIILAEVGSIIVGYKLLKEINIPIKNILLYALNPLIIIELTGNLHFEAIMIFFLLLSIYYLHIRSTRLSLIFMSLSISLKLITLILVPGILSKLKNKIIGIIGLAILVFILLSPILWDNSQYNYLSSISLWFNKFEFNASLYYILRELGFLIKDYNLIKFIGPVLSTLSLAAIIAIFQFRRNRKSVVIIENMMFAFSIYFMFATTIHPWYIATLIALSIFTSFKFPTIWSLFIIFSYFSYKTEPFKENYNLILLEYIIIYSCFILEILRKEKLKSIKILTPFY